MKKLILTCAFFLFIVSSAFTQEINKLSNGMNIKQGTIILDDGQTKKFQNMDIEGINLTYYDMQGQKYNSDLSNVYAISRLMNYIRKGAIWGAASGLFLGFFWESINTNDETFQPLHYMGGAAIGGVIFCGVGALIGKIMSVEKVCYKNQANYKPVVGLSFQPRVRDLNNKLYPELSMKINF